MFSISVRWSRSKNFVKRYRCSAGCIIVSRDSLPEGDLVFRIDTTRGHEFSVQAGIINNLENDDTGYKTGAEFHLDFGLSQFLSENFALGVRGYYYKQVTGDSGSGAVLGDFKGESFGIGPGFFWRPKFASGKLVVIGKWMHDLTATNRLESDYGSIAAAWKF